MLNFIKKQLKTFNDEAVIHALKLSFYVSLFIITYGAFLSGFQVVDEFEHLHASWLVSEGFIPYRDFFEHHHPLLWYISAPIVSIFYDNVIIFYFMRGVTILVSFATLFYVYKIALFYTDKNEIVTNPDSEMGKEYEILSKQISDTEYIVYQTLILSEHEWRGTIKSVDIKLKQLYFMVEDLYLFGDWQFKLDNLSDKYKNVNCLKLNVDKQIDNQLKLNSIIINNSGMFGALERIEFSYKEEQYEEDFGKNYILKVLDNKNNVIGEFELITSQMKSGDSPLVYQYMSELKNNEEYKILIYNNENYDNIEFGKEQSIDIISFTYDEKDLFRNN